MMHRDPLLVAEDHLLDTLPIRVGLVLVAGVKEAGQAVEGEVRRLPAQRLDTEYVVGEDLATTIINAYGCLDGVDNFVDTEGFYEPLIPT